MRALSLTQPWATLVALGQKTIETRSWATSYRGPLAIHAAKGLGPVGGMTGLKALCSDNPFYSALLYAVHQDILEAPAAETMPRGAIVAVCELVDCQPTTALDDGFFSGPRSIEAGSMVRLWKLTDQERAFGNYAPGRYAWLLTNIRALPEPVPCRGALGLWDLDAASVATVEKQL